MDRRKSMHVKKAFRWIFRLSLRICFGIPKGSKYNTLYEWEQPNLEKFLELLKKPIFHSDLDALIFPLILSPNLQISATMIASFTNHAIQLSIIYESSKILVREFGKKFEHEKDKGCLQEKKSNFYWFCGLTKSSSRTDRGKKEDNKWGWLETRENMRISLIGTKDTREMERLDLSLVCTKICSWPKSPSWWRMTKPNQAIAFKSMPFGQSHYRNQGKARKHDRWVLNISPFSVWDLRDPQKVLQHDPDS